MGTLMHLLLEALKANVREGRNLQDSNDDHPHDEMSGFILENVQVATMPYIESEDDDDEPNPLMQLVQREKPPRETLWVASHTVSDADPSHDDSDYYPDEEGRSHGGDYDGRGSVGKKHSAGSKGASPAKKSGSPKQSPPRAEKRPSRVATRPIRLEKEERSCFARLLFSRCWTGKDHAAGWKIKRKCPAGHKASLSCPCGQIGPCKKVKQNAVPIDKLTGSGKKKKTNSGAGCKSSGKGANNKNQKSGSGPRHSPQKFGDKLKCGTLYEKLFPCCFKEHKHNECCCRCKDNPPLMGHSPRKSKEEATTPKKASSVEKKSGKRKSEEDHKSPSHEPDSGNPSEYTDDEDGSGYYDDNQSEFHAYNLRSVSDLSRDREKINQLSRKRASGDIQKSKRKHSRTKPIDNEKSKDTKTYASWTDNIPAPKSTTSFQIMLHPDISNDQMVEPEVVSHQILKTLSTVHGPVKVEQKIVVQGSQNSVVIVTHGESCQCNLCNMLKGKMHPKELMEGLSPQVVKISTDNGYNTLINHSDGCKCDLCLVLDPVVIKNDENPTPQLENERLIMAACSATNENGTEKKSDGPDVDNRKNGSIIANPLNRKSKNKTINGKKKSRKCHCTKCRQRRRIEKLKLRLKKEMGSEEYDRIIQEITRPNENDVREKPKHRETSDDSNDCYVKSRRNKRMVSFSDDPDPREHRKFREQWHKESSGKTRCKLCELTNEAHGVFRQKDRKKRWEGRNNSTVYSINTSSHDTPCEFHVYDRTIGDDLPKSKSKFSEKRVRSFVQEEQKCFPPKRVRRAPYENKEKPKVMEDLSTFDDDSTRSHLRHGSGCSGKCRREGVQEDATLGTSGGILLQDGAFPQKFVYWAPGSRSNMATAYSSESYYVPDRDEFPIVNVECEDSAPSSGGTPMHRVHFPVWFRMLPERKNS